MVKVTAQRMPCCGAAGTRLPREAMPPLPPPPQSPPPPPLPPTHCRRLLRSDTHIAHNNARNRERTLAKRETLRVFKEASGFRPPPRECLCTV